MTKNELIAELELQNKEDIKHLKGYMFDSLVYRYKLARHRMAEMEKEEDLKCGKRKELEYYKLMEDRDVRRFIEILAEAIGERD